MADSLNTTNLSRGSILGTGLAAASFARAFILLLDGQIQVLPAWTGDARNAMAWRRSSSNWPKIRSSPS